MHFEMLIKYERRNEQRDLKSNTYCCNLHLIFVLNTIETNSKFFICKSGLLLILKITFFAQNVLHKKIFAKRKSQIIFILHTLNKN